MEDEPENFSIPEKIFQELFDLSGSEKVGRGVLIFYIGDDGTVHVHMQTDATVLSYGILSAARSYIEETHPDSTCSWSDNMAIDEEDSE